MSGWLLDTNVLSELRRERPDARVENFVASRPLERLYISTVTLAEIRFGIENVADPLKRARLSEWLDLSVRPMFERRILAVSEDVMLRWRLFVDQGRKARHTYSQPDLIIAATAACHGLTVVTRDVSEFERAGVPVVDPWIA